MFKKIFVIVSFLVITATSAQADLNRIQPVYNIVDSAIVTSSGNIPTAEQIEKAFIDAAQYKRWSVRRLDNGTLQAFIDVRRHYAEVNMTHTKNTYSIVYSNSKELMYDGKKIHRNYNKWIKLLDRVFRKNLNTY